MPYRLWLKLAVILTAIALLVAAVHAWRADRRDRAQLAAELAATKQLLTAAGPCQRDQRRATRSNSFRTRRPKACPRHS